MSKRDSRNVGVIWLIALMLLHSWNSITPDSKWWELDIDCNTPLEKCDRETLRCEHKGIFPLEIEEFLGSILLGVCLAMWNAGGIGGGGIIVTIWVTLFSLSAKESVAMSNFVIFFGSVARYIKNFNSKHPLKDTPVIDYDIVTSMLPLIMLGAFIGVELNRSFPRLLVFILLTTTLTFLSIKSILKSISTYQKESYQIKKENREAEVIPVVNINEESQETEKQEDEVEKMLQADEEQETEELTKSNHHKNEVVYEPLLVESNKPGIEDKRNFKLLKIKRQSSHVSFARGPAITKETANINILDLRAVLGEHQSSYKLLEVNIELVKLLELEKRHFRLRNIYVALSPFVTFMIITLLRGSPKIKSIIGVERCDSLDFMLLVINVAILIILEIINIYMLK